LTQESSSTQQALNQQKTTTNILQAASNNLQAATSHQIAPIQQSPQSNPSFSWDFGQNYAFGGTFSSSSPFSFDPNPTHTEDTDSQGTLSTQDTITTKDSGITTHDPIIPTQDSGINVQDAGVNTHEAGTNTQDAGISVQDGGMSIQDAGISGEEAIRRQDSTTSLTQDTTSSVQDAASQDRTMRNGGVGVGVADLISQSMSGGGSVGEVVQGSKWLLVWLNGVSSLQQFSRVYLMFTSTRMVLYCPCNTYYATYQLQGNALKA
jgi:hypothetical protein